MLQVFNSNESDETPICAFSPVQQVSVIKDCNHNHTSTYLFLFVVNFVIIARSVEITDAVLILSRFEPPSSSGGSGVYILAGTGRPVGWP